ncbi:energy-coupling factor transporter transmembrane component T family protein [Cetobacterium sp.]|uniref:energy-coupling factor transporter transmembrane component T family protein n=1 Tax=Cetobacterium sp. TaxID=2071632 RepID=UPI003EE53DB0
MRLQKFDPRTVFYATLICIIALGFIKKPYQILILLPVIFYQIRLFSINVDKLKKILKYSSGLMFSIVVINFFLIGRPSDYVVISFSRLIMIIFLATSMVSSLEIREIGFVIEKTLSPLKVFKIPVESIGVITALSFKFIPMLQEEAERVVLAQKARGIDYELMTLKEKIGNITTLFFPIVISGIQNAINLAISMEVRGYGNGAIRSRLRSYGFLKKDYQHLIFITIFCIIFSFLCITF